VNEGTSWPLSGWSPDARLSLGLSAQLPWRDPAVDRPTTDSEEPRQLGLRDSPLQV